MWPCVWWYTFDCTTLHLPSGLTCIIHWLIDWSTMCTCTATPKGQCNKLWTWTWQMHGKPWQLPISFSIWIHVDSITYLQRSIALTTSNTVTQTCKHWITGKTRNHFFNVWYLGLTTVIRSIWQVMVVWLQVHAYEVELFWWIAWQGNAYYREPDHVLYSPQPAHGSVVGWLWIARDGSIFFVYIIGLAVYSKSTDGDSWLYCAT